jgi:hypothetical protein
MGKFLPWLKKNRIRISIIWTIFYVILGLVFYYFLDPDEDFYTWNGYFIWYFIGMQWIWFDNDPAERIRELYFQAGFMENIRQDIQAKGFGQRTENDKKVVFILPKKKYFNPRLTIKKDNPTIWRLKGRQKYLAALEKYRLQFVR